jgi:hypothetical protein
MALQFFAVHSEALATTHDALQRHASAHGLRPPGPTRVLRIAQLFGHLQLRSAGRSSVVVALSELAATWRFQPRQLRQDLALLQALGWLSARGTTRGTVISLSGPEPADRADGYGLPAQGFPEPAGPHPAKPEPPALRVGQIDLAAPFAARPEPAAQPVPAPSPKPAPPVGCPSPPETAKAPKADESRDLLQRLAGLYNQHRPPTWPAYQPRGNGLGTKLRQALRQAGSADALADTLTAALHSMPPFWRTTYPQGRSGSECIAALFSTDRGCAGMGVEFWHLFSWAQAALECSAESGGDWSDSDASERPAMAAGRPADELQRARRLFLWDSGVWRGQGREALLLSQREKRELALLLEASGEGIPGTAERQFLDPEPEPDPEPPELPEIPKAPAPSAAPSEAGMAGNGQPEPHHGPPRGAQHRADRNPNSPSPVQPPHSRPSRRRRPAHRKPSLQHQRAGPSATNHSPARPIAPTSPSTVSSEHEPTNRSPEQRFHRSC